jgi:type I restriction-modification system DNA methylase subunit
VSYFLIPLVIIAAILLLFGIFVLLARFRNGKYLRPIVLWLSKIPWLKRQFEKVSQAALEKQNPDLASAMRKLQRAGANADMKKLQAVYNSFTPEERRAYQEMADQQGGGIPDNANRQMRRAQQRMAQANRGGRGGSGGTGGSGGSSGTKRGKKR